MFALFEVTARCPIETSRSLDTRGVATAKPQLFPPYCTTICVVLSPRAAFRWRGRTDDVTQPGPGARHFSYAGTLRKKERSEQELYPRQKGQRQVPPVDRYHPKNRGIVKAPHRDKGNGRTPGPGSQVENSHLLSAPLTPLKKVRFSVTSLDLTMSLHNTSYQSPMSARNPLDNPRRTDSAVAKTLILHSGMFILSTLYVPVHLDNRSISPVIYSKSMFVSSKGVFMPSHDYNVDPVKSTGDPRTTACDCGTSLILPKHPGVHCPKCHASYRSKSLQRPAFCAHCNFNLRAWRLRNNIPDLNVPFL